ncbi:hypothetical protein QJS10_CPB12g01123 [Acorus calamus]|uniref:CHCH domain-containing protein n=1 Tax=Acorus calamus TaxID=4465 RepID=A0AAV9DNI7_ACOCL|nr:hypothetical protein QJS10_CPB12g01123 [Acorus calamus]
MERPSPQPLCPKEALDLLNCATGADFDPDKCLRFLNALRACVLEKPLEKQYAQPSGPTLKWAA